MQNQVADITLGSPLLKSLNACGIASLVDAIVAGGVHDVHVCRIHNEGVNRDVGQIAAAVTPSLPGVGGTKHVPGVNGGATGPQRGAAADSNDVADERCTWATQSDDLRPRPTASARIHAINLASYGADQDRAIGNEGQYRCRDRVDAAPDVGSMTSVHVLPQSGETNTVLPALLMILPRTSIGG